MTYIKVDRAVLLSVSEEMKRISSEVDNLSRNYYEIASQLELDIRDCYHIQKAADRLQSRLKNESKGLRNVGNFLIQASDTYAFFDDTSAIPDNQESSGNSGSGESSYGSDNSEKEGEQGLFDHIPVLGPIEDLLIYYVEILTNDETYPPKEMLDKWWTAFGSTISLWKNMYSEVEKVYDEIKELPAGEIVKWIPLVNVAYSTGSEWSYWYNEYTQDGDYSLSEAMKTLIYASTNGLMHVGTNLINTVSGGTGIPESILFNMVIDGGGSRQAADAMIDGAEEMGTWIGNMIVNLKRKWR